jgi:hypothetical protein
LAFVGNALPCIQTHFVRDGKWTARSIINIRARLED